MKKLLIIIFITFPLYANNAIPEFNLDYKVEKEEKEVSKELTIEEKLRLSLSKKNLSDTLIDYLLAQARHETGLYTNNLTKKHNNIFARLHSPKDTLSMGGFAWAEGRIGYAHYKSIDSAAISQIAYLNRMGYSMKWNNTKEFVWELKRRRYFTAPVERYWWAVELHYRNIQKEKQLKQPS